MFTIGTSTIFIDTEKFIDDKQYSSIFHVSTPSSKQPYIVGIIVIPIFQ